MRRFNQIIGIIAKLFKQKAIPIELTQRNHGVWHGSFYMDLFKEYGITKEEMLDTADGLIELYEKYGEIYNDERLETFKGVLIELLKDYRK